MAYQTSSHSQTLELLMAYRQNPSVHLRNRVVNQNTGLVRKVAHRLAHQSPIPFEDLQQVGYLGLITAVERFDPSHGCAFSSFAVPYIRGEILHFLRDRSNAVRIPRNLQQLSTDGAKATQALRIKLGRQPNDNEIAAELNIELHEWHNVKLSSMNRMPMSLDAKLQAGTHHQTDSAMTLGDTLTDLHYAVDSENAYESLDLQHALSQLEAKTREMIELVFIHQTPRQEVAKRTGFSAVTVTRRIKKGMEELNQILQQSSLATQA